MTAGSGATTSGAAGGPARHIPVLRREALDALGLKPGGRYVDGTFGAGGYTRAILDAYSDTRVLAIDRDPNAIAAGQELARIYGDRLVLVEGRFGDLDAIVASVGFGQPDGVVLDIGVSSMQLDEAIRGFSFRNDGPLDMRMEQAGASAADIVNDSSEAELANIIYHFGEERLSRPIARALVAARKAQPFATTRQLAEAVAKVVWAKPGEIHPATRTFQALRIAVNDELGELVRALHAAERALGEGGRLAVVSFHSLEDRIVKVFLAARSGKVGGSRHAPVAAADAPTFKSVGKQPVIPGEEELAANPRARSAKLRAAIRMNTPARPTDPTVASLAALPPVLRQGRR